MWSRKTIRGTNLRFGKTFSCGCLDKEIKKTIEYDLVGQNFGFLKVLCLDKMKNSIAYWKCICSCGKVKSVRGTHLRGGLIHSCGCMRKEDMNEKRYGLLFVISFSSIRKGQTYWNCLCDCGNIKEVNRKHLVSGNAISCGCFKIRSKMEERVEKILFAHKINFERQCKLPFSKHRLDFLLEHDNKSVCIECQGIQHYEIVGYFGGEKGFQQRKSQDARKKEYLKTLNIPLIEIPYWEEDIETFLFEELERLK